MKIQINATIETDAQGVNFDLDCYQNGKQVTDIVLVASWVNNLLANLLQAHLNQEMEKPSVIQMAHAAPRLSN